jgi:hypothetical protein
VTTETGIVVGRRASGDLSTAIERISRQQTVIRRRRSRDSRDRGRLFRDRDVCQSQNRLLSISSPALQSPSSSWRARRERDTTEPLGDHRRQLSIERVRSVAGWADGQEILAKPPLSDGVQADFLAATTPEPQEKWAGATTTVGGSVGPRDM